MGVGRDVNSNRSRVLLNIYIGIELQDSKRGGEGRKIATFHVYRVFNVLLAVTTMVSQKSIWVYKKFKKSTKSPRPPPLYTPRLVLLRVAVRLYGIGRVGNKQGGKREGGEGGGGRLCLG